MIVVKPKVKKRRISPAQKPHPHPDRPPLRLPHLPLPLHLLDLAVIVILLSRPPPPPDARNGIDVFPTSGLPTKRHHHHVAPAHPAKVLKRLGQGLRAGFDSRLMASMPDL